MKNELKKYYLVNSSTIEKIKKLNKPSSTITSAKSNTKKSKRKYTSDQFKKWTLLQQILQPKVIKKLNKSRQNVAPTINTFMNSINSSPASFEQTNDFDYSQPITDLNESNLQVVPYTGNQSIVKNELLNKNDGLLHNINDKSIIKLNETIDDILKKEKKKDIDNLLQNQKKPANLDNLLKNVLQDEMIVNKNHPFTLFPLSYPPNPRKKVLPIKRTPIRTRQRARFEQNMMKARKINLKNILNNSSKMETSTDVFDPHSEATSSTPTKKNKRDRMLSKLNRYDMNWKHLDFKNRQKK